ncbi:MAG: rRNA maturation RNase YbeY [Gemmatimonadota bacterium]|jgi:probable rRNA maturation factor|nr:rRNA maturation RNase YbeY [Gemmatimonadota bacterium]
MAVNAFVEISDETASVDSSLLELLERAVRTTLEAEAPAGEVEISVALLDDEGISRVNQEFLSHEGPTDVISFPLVQPGLSLVGDIYVGLDQAHRQASEFGVAVEEELVRLAVHGVLHVLGWEHPEDEGRLEAPMYTRQEEIVRRVLI